MCCSPRKSPASTRKGPSVPARRNDLRNVAIVAHVDHGKTTLVDAMLRQTGAFRAHQELTDRVMDSMDLEREKGITILAKNTAVDYDGVKINIVDTPGHADFGGEVERGLTMVDGVLLLVDASEGPLPQTRFVLRKALEARLPVVLVVNKVDRTDARVGRGRPRGGGAVPRPRRRRAPDRLPDRLLQRAQRPRVARPQRPRARRSRGPAGADGLKPLLELLLEHIPAPDVRRDAPAAGARHQPRRVAVRRPARALPHPPRRAAARASRSRGAGPTAAIETVKITEMYVTEALDRVDANEAGPGEIVAIAGLADVTIGETLADPDDPRPLPVIHIDDPSLSMTVGINTSPLAGRTATSSPPAS